MNKVTTNYFAEDDEDFRVSCSLLRYQNHPGIEATADLLKIGPLTVFATAEQLEEIHAAIENYLQPPLHPVLQAVQAEVEGVDDIPF